MKSIILLCFILFISCSDQPIVDAGSLANNIYSNEYFGFKITKPNSWYAYSDEERIELMKRGLNLTAGDDQNLKNLMKENMIKTINLFTFYENQPGTPVDFNINISSVAENIKNLPGIKTGEDYLKSAKILLNRSQIKYEIADSITIEKIGGKEFYRMNTQMKIADIKVNQRFYAAIIKDFAFSLVAASIDEEGRNKIDSILYTAKFTEL